MFIIKIINNNLWIKANKDETPSATDKRGNAQKFKNRSDAEKKITKITKTEPFDNFVYGIEKWIL